MPTPWRRCSEDVNDRAALGVPPEAIALVVRRGHGSARDALSALDQVAAAGTVDDEATILTDVIEAVADRDPGRVLLEVAEAISSGRDPRRLGTELLEQLRDGFLATQARQLVLLADDAVAAVEAQARRLGTPALVRAMEVLGQALIDMRDAPDPRITLEVALVRLSAADADDSRSALLARIERLERLVGERGEEAAASVPAVRSIRPPSPPDPSPPAGTPPPVTAVATQSALGAHRRPREAHEPAGQSLPGPAGRDPVVSPGPASTPPARPAGRDPGAVARAGIHAAGGSPPGPAPAPASSRLPTREELTIAWGDSILSGLRPGVKIYLSSGRFIGVDAAAATYAVPDRGLLARAEANRAEVEAAVSAHFGRSVPLRLVLDEAGPVGAVADAPSEPALDDATTIDLNDLVDAPAAVLSPEQRLLEAFPGAEEVSP